MIDFAKLLTPEQRAQLAALVAEIDRLYHASDVELAQSLLALARRCRALRPDYHGTAFNKDRHYGTSFVWSIIPELAHALAHRAGVTLLLEDDEGSIELGGEFAAQEWRTARLHVGTYVQHNGRLFGRPAGLAPGEIDPWQLLTAEVPNGNPVAFALDRLIAPAADDRDDWIAERIAEVASHRGHPPLRAWQPSMNEQRTRAHA
jgi:hypothetical protein